MVNSNNSVCLLDADVLLNWLAKEVDFLSGEELWKAPNQILRMIEEKTIRGFSTLLHLMEVRSVLRRKNSFAEETINSDISTILNLLEIVIPDEVNLLKADSIQSNHPLFPIDATLISVGLTIENAVLISRDKNLLKIACRFLPASTPEDFLKNIR